MTSMKISSFRHLKQELTGNVHIIMATTQKNLKAKHYHHHHHALHYNKAIKPSNKGANENTAVTMNVKTNMKLQKKKKVPHSTHQAHPPPPTTLVMRIKNKIYKSSMRFHRSDMSNEWGHKPPQDIPFLNSPHIDICNEGEKEESK